MNQRLSVGLGALLSVMSVETDAAINNKELDVSFSVGEILKKAREAVAQELLTVPAKKIDLEEFVDEKSASAVPSDLKIAKALVKALRPSSGEYSSIRDWGFGFFEYLTAARYLASRDMRNAVLDALDEANDDDRFRSNIDLARSGTKPHLLQEVSTLSYPLWNEADPLNAAYFQVIRARVERERDYYFENPSFSRKSLNEVPLDKLIADDLSAGYRGRIRETLYFSKVDYEDRTHGGTIDNVFILLNSRRLKGSLRSYLAQLQYLQPDIDLKQEITLAVDDVKEIQGLHRRASRYNPKGADYAISFRAGNSCWYSMEGISSLKRDLLQIELFGSTLEAAKQKYGHYLADAARGDFFEPEQVNLTPEALQGKSFSVEVLNLFGETAKARSFRAIIHFRSLSEAIIQYGDEADPVGVSWSLRGNVIQMPSETGNLILPLSVRESDLAGPMEGVWGRSIFLNHVLIVPEPVPGLAPR